MQKFKTKTILGSLFLLIIFGNLNAQIKSGTAEVSKTLKKAVYGGSYILENGNVGIFFQEKEELAAYEFDENAQYVVTHHGSEAHNLLGKADRQLNTVSHQANAVEVSPDKGLNIMYAKESWGSLKLVNGLIYLSSTDKFINGFELETKE